MDTHTLTAFICVAEQGSFSAASERLYLTQSAVSKRIALLEEQLGQKLFDRIGRQISLTEAGHALLPRARDILIAFDDARNAMSHLSDSVSGTLTLAASHHIGLHRLPKTLKQYSQRYPDVELNLSFGESEAAYEGVIKGNLELALITLSPTPDENICTVAVWEDRLVFVAAPDHPLATHSALTLDQLADYQAILPDERTFTWQITAQRFEEARLQWKVTQPTNYLDSIKMMVATGLGWSLLPETMLDSSLVSLPVAQSKIVRQLGCIYHRNRTLSNAAQRFVAQLTETDS